MLLPSALSCDSSHRNAPSTRFQSAVALFSSPPTSPPPNAQSTLFATCRALQSMLSSPNQLPTPPMTHAPAPAPSPSPFKLRLRSRKPADGDEDITAAAPRVARKRITKRTSAAPRGINKRRRPIDDDAAAAAARNITPESDNDENRQPVDEMIITSPRTPKRMRLAPEVLPRGLERSDFHKLQAPFTTSRASLSAPEPQSLLFNDSSSSCSCSNQHQNQNQHQHQHDQPTTDNTSSGTTNNGASSLLPPSATTATASSDNDNIDNDEWSSAEDRLLVELVLEKLKLSKSDWQDCARSLGKDRGSVGRRWKSLMGGGEVGLKNCGGGGGGGAGGFGAGGGGAGGGARQQPWRRGRIHATWRN